MDRRWLARPRRARARWSRSGTSPLFTVPQWMQAMVVQLGEPVRVVREPGLYWKIPFIQQVTYFDRRLLDYDASPKEILTIDKQQLVVDNLLALAHRRPAAVLPHRARRARRAVAPRRHHLLRPCARRSAATRCARS